MHRFSTGKVAKAGVEKRKRCMKAIIGRKKRFRNVVSIKNERCT